MNHAQIIQSSGSFLLAALFATSAHASITVSQCETDIKAKTEIVNAVQLRGITADAELLGSLSVEAQKLIQYDISHITFYAASYSLKSQIELCQKLHPNETAKWAPKTNEEIDTEITRDGEDAPPKSSHKFAGTLNDRLTPENFSADILLDESRRAGGGSRLGRDRTAK